MKWEGGEESQNVEDRRGMGGSTLMAGGGGIVVLILALVFGVSPSTITRFLGNGGSPGGTNSSSPQDTGLKHVNPQQDQLAKFTSIIFHDTEVIWDDLFQKMGKQYPKPTLVLFSDQVTSACGSADAAVGPFYCPGDNKVYIDLSFYADMQRKLDAPGDFARAYVVAHEVGHHVQGLLGYADRANRIRKSADSVEAHHQSVRLELQADYFAGVWAYHAQKRYNFLEKGDVETALKAAFEIGDDRLQKKARGTVVPDTFTHGTSKQRMTWFNKGFTTGDVQGAAALFDLSYEKL
jgi:predicted metalloprotease